MERGRIVEIGPHDDLMEKQGAYWRLYEAQPRQADNESPGSVAERALVALVLGGHAAHPAGDA